MNRVLCVNSEAAIGAVPGAPEKGGRLSAAQAFLIRLCDGIATWQERAASRRMLAQLDDRLLRDIGLDKAAAVDEAAKPFWRE